MRTACIILVALALFVGSGGLSVAQETNPVEVPPRRTLPVTRASESIEIDGTLDDAAWAGAAVVDLPYEWFPGDNISPPVRTECLVTYDEGHLYVAFRAFDPDPSQIRAHLADRDAIETIVQDDHIGFQVDPFNDERRAFQFRVNALGVQADAIFSELDGIEDFSWDAIWESAGRITDDGYVVEVAIPFHQLRFPRTSPQTWGLDAFRSYPRSQRHRMANYFRDPNRSCLLCQVDKLSGFEGMHPGRNLEVAPTLTGTRTDRRDDFPAGSLETERKELDPGLSVRWGITPNLALNGTLNPDFSQVEADVAQLEVNTRFALFYPEKRPFFLEGIDFFATPLDMVFTRTVVDPSAGLKLTGKAGSNAFGVFMARDRVNNLILPSNQRSDFASLEQEVTSTVARYRRDMGTGSTLGVLYAGREGEGYHNRTYGFDGFLRLSDADTLRFQLMRSDTVYPEDPSLPEEAAGNALTGNGGLLDYNHNSRNWFWSATYQDLAPGFRADSGFVPRVDVRTVDLTLGGTVWGDADRWFSRFNLGVTALNTENHRGKLTDRTLGAFATYRGPWQSLVTLQASRIQELYLDTTYDLDRLDLNLDVQPRGGLRLGLAGRIGDAIDLASARRGELLRLNPRLEIRPGRRVELVLDHAFERLSVREGRVYTAHLTQGRLVYYFGTRAFARAILQYTDLEQTPALYTDPVEPRTRQLFSQLLFSYKVNPQTVLLVGYSDNGSGLEDVALTRTDRTFFLKIGYAWVP
ncbi:MAG: DUF5916 domain-containing protein [Acidobacteriota bacterium]